MASTIRSTSGRTGALALFLVAVSWPALGIADPPAAQGGVRTDSARERDDALRVGRELVRAGRPAEALAHFERALTIDGSSPRIRCEAGFVAFRAGQQERADDYVSQALRDFPDDARLPSELRAPVAMCLYNAALVYEARGKTDAARGALERSLRLRPNAMVQARLEALSSTAIADCLARAPELATGPLAAGLASRACEDAGGDPEACRSNRPSTVHVEAVSHPPELVPTFEASLLTTRTSTEAQAVTTWLLVDAPGDRRLVRLGSVRASPIFDGDGIEVRARFHDVVPGAPPEVVLEVDAIETDPESSQCESSARESRLLVVCTSTPSVRCASIDLGEVETHWSADSCDSGMPEGRGRTQRRGHFFEARFGRDTLSLVRVAGAAPAGAVTSFPVATLFERGDLRYCGAPTPAGR